MGQSQSPFTRDELNEYFGEYELLTYLKRGEILDIYEKFRHVDHCVVKHKGTHVPFERLQASIPELDVNPFADRLCKIRR